MPHRPLAASRSPQRLRALFRRSLRRPFGPSLRALCGGAGAALASALLVVPLALPLPAHAQATPGEAPGHAVSRLDAVLQRGALRVCTTGDYKPYSFLRPDGAFEGIDIDLSESLAKSLGVKTEYVRSSWSGLMKDFLAKCDIAVGGVSTSLERQRLAFFTHPYMVDGKTPIARCADVGKYQTLADLNQPSVRAIVNPGGTNEKFAKQFFPQATLTVYPDNVTIFKQIVDGKADVMVTDASETLLQHKLNPQLCSIHPDKPFQYGEKAFMLPQGDVVFQQYVDQWLHLARASGEYQAVVDKWLK